MQSNGITLVFLTKGKVALIDTADAEHILSHKWHTSKGGYAARSIRKGGKRHVFLHHAILQPRSGFQTDHANGNRLDNRRCNLRYSTPSQNGANKKLLKANRSGFRGVSWFKPARLWSAEISHQGKKHHLGYFRDSRDAAAAYDAAALELHGSFARVNFGAEDHHTTPICACELPLIVPA